MRAEVILIPAPAVGHLVSAVEFAKLLVSRDDRISVSILIMNMSFDATFVAFTNHLKKDAPAHITFVDIPALDEIIMTELMAKPKFYFFTWFIESQKGQVRDVVATIMNRSESSKLVGFVIDMMCETMIDVANEYNVPAYVLSTSSAAFLGLMFSDLSFQDNKNQGMHEYKDSDVELSVPCFLNPVPSKVLPSLLITEDSSSVFRTIAQRSRETKGIIVNTVLELEAYAIKSIVEDGNTPPVYHVGPIIKLADVEIKMDYVKGTGCLVKAEEIERGIRCLMQEESETRKKAKEMKDICRKATAKRGSSYTSVGQFIEDLMDSGALD
ncbi:hypothetical protein POM88_052507 [Heracleum sosnowskyi]|uniref:Uncharacterized protein n=1 Tax=Heracleum sosnowskyi TaxID=360622 RepID=A0AAD8LYT2_9APIA|nr:hypothetical protein POM88_052507 [Heracleum sosnowskyi]